ncbi:Ig-like domain-containing protein [Curtobacterium sp. MCLR17_036]|uniref:Ig-like domain-containing protein n=1 Tax=Curtobacterium sp. MCLR17_036 TaxID=2175620 RepID=UPI0024DFC105|nr:Ig-like domain-containing protein [Curtobacterium sp. MCLR17_036]WIE63565.1 Ig-like domain-containing protein [Curtobacterium sp. MCLR17_036]
MIRALLAKHRSAAVTTGVSVLVAAVVAGTAIVSTGYHTQRVDLGDGTVWVPSAEYGAVGRANTQVLQLNTAVETASDDLSVLQRGSTVYSVDETKGTVAKVDVAAATVGDAVTLPAGSPQVFLAGDTAVIGNAETGELWATPADQLEEFDASTKADLTLGADTVFDASDDHVAVYSAKTGTASLVDIGATLTVDRRWKVDAGRGDDFQVAAFGSHLAVLDRTSGTLTVDGDAVDLGDRVGSSPALQRSSDAGSDVTVAGTAGLARVTPSGRVDGTPLAVSGRAARPYVDGSCTYAAWAGGQAVDTCDGRALQRLASTGGTSEMQILHNGRTVVANDPSSGRSWAIDRSGQLIDNWSDLVEQDDQKQREQVSDEDPEVDKDQKPPVAVDDELGARPGRTTSLPVLLNDYDPNGDPIVVSEVGRLSDSAGRVAIVGDGQRLQVTLSSRASGTVSFQYTITDGNGGSDTATVRVSVRPESQNEAPRQVRDTSADVVQNGHVVTNVLGDWVDPDGDPVYLESATASDRDNASTTPDGLLDYRNDSGRTGERSVQVVVSDGRADGRGSATMRVAKQGSVPLRADPFPVSGYAGKAFSVDPLDHVRGGNGTVTLTSVSSASGLTVTPSYDAGTFRVLGAGAGDHQLEYTVTDGVKTSSGIVRVTILAPPDASTAPITTPKTVFVNTLSTKDTDVTATDIDPAGGVLMVSAIDAPQRSSGVQASILDQHTVRITLTAPLDGPVSFEYTETNGLASSTGTITVVEIPRPDRIQPPVAQPDSSTVRVGDVANIAVLDNDTQPEGEPLTLEPDLVQNVPGDGGLLFVSGDHLRYLAPKTPGNYTAVYRVAGPDGQHADASVSISVRERDAATNNPPVPPTVTARVVAGSSVRVSIPLNGVDPDGDSVQLVGVGSNPDKGSVSDVSKDSLTYQAGDYSAGTDEFTYTVVDALGARASGTVRVGIAPRAEQASNPVAQADHVTIRPGGSVTVRVMQNDSDPEGGQLTVTAAEPTADDVAAKILRKQQIRVTPPKTAKSGDYAVLYTVTNSSGGSSTAFLTVTVDEDAQPLRPEVDDTTLDLQDILHRQTVTVDVLENVFFAEGTSADLRVGLVDGYGDTARTTDDDRITVRLTDDSQVIPFSVARVDHPDIVSYGFINVPGFDDALPQINRSAGSITVKSEATVRIPLDDFVVTANGKTATITDRGTVKATHANGQRLVVDSSTLQFTSSKLYYGNASISFEVTDGSSANGGKGRVATLVLPITVTPRSNQPPAFTGSAVEMQPGERRTIDLTKLTDYPYPRDLPELRYSVVGRPADGVTASIAKQRLTIAVADTAKKNTTAAIGVGVTDDANAGRAGTVTVGIVGSTRPLVQPGADRSVTKRGATTTIDVLTNDQPTNPFPGQRLRVVNIRGLSGGLPSGVTVTPSEDRSRLQVRVSDTAKPVDAHLQYQVADATNDPNRYVWGDVTISVQDVPDAPGTPTRTGSYDGGQLSLTWAAPQGNNSPITGYRVVGTNGLTKNCGTSTVCQLTGIDPKASYRFQVVATNAIGDSKPSARSVSMSADYVPAPPKNITVSPSKSTPNQLDVAWTPVPAPKGGSAVDDYVVTVKGPGLSTMRRTGTATSTSFTGAESGAKYSVSVSARNDADRNGTVVQWNSGSGSGTAVGTPGKPSNVQAEAGAQADESGRSTVNVTWGPADAAGGSGLRYAAYRSADVDCKAPPSNSLGTSSPARDSGVGAGTTRYAVTVSNGYFCNVAYADAVTYERPTATGRAGVDVTKVGTNTWNVSVTASSRDAHHYQLETGGQTVSLRPGETWTGVPGSGARNVAVQLLVRACGGPGSSFCTSDDQSWTGTAAAYDTTATVTSAQEGQPLGVTGPSGTGVGVHFTAYWYLDEEGTVPALPRSAGWNAGEATPTPLSYAKSVKVRATLTLADGSNEAIGDASEAFPITPAPEPEPDPEPAPSDPVPSDPAAP